MLTKLRLFFQQNVCKLLEDKVNVTKRCISASWMVFMSLKELRFKLKIDELTEMTTSVAVFTLTNAVPSPLCWKLISPATCPIS